MEDKPIEKLNALALWTAWLHSGNYRTDMCIERIVKAVDEKVNEIIDELNKQKYGE